MPVAVIDTPSEPALMQAVTAQVRDHEPDAIVGLPLNMDGTEGKPAQDVRALMERLTARTGLPVHAPRTND